MHADIVWRVQFSLSLSIYIYIYIYMSSRAVLFLLFNCLLLLCVVNVHFCYLLFRICMLISCMHVRVPLFASFARGPPGTFDSGLMLDS